MMDDLKDIEADDEARKFVKLIDDNEPNDAYKLFVRTGSVENLPIHNPKL